MIDNKIQSIVASVCSDLYDSARSEHVNIKKIHAALNRANEYGVLKDVFDFFSGSKQFGGDLEQLLTERVPTDQQSHMKYLISSGKSFTRQDNHVKAYRIAEKLWACVVKSPDFFQAFEYISQAANECVMETTTTVFDAFFGSELRDGAGSKGLNAWVSSSFSGDEASRLTELINSGEQTFKCEPDSVVTYNATANTTASDRKSGHPAAKPTLGSGSSRELAPRDTDYKHNEPFLQAVTTSSTLGTVYTARDTAESAEQSFIHSRLSHIINVSNTGVDALTDVADAFVGSNSKTKDKSRDDTKLTNRFIQNQIGNRRLVTDNDGKAVTE